MPDGLHGLGGQLPPQAWNALLFDGSSRTYERGETLLVQGDTGSYVLVLFSGRVKVSRVEYDGTEMLLAVRFPGEILGEIAILDGEERSATVTALEACLAYALPAARFLRIIDRYDARDLVMKHILARYREGERIRAELAGLPAPQRLVATLVRLAEAAQSENANGNGRPSVDLKLSQSELASGIGLSRATVADELAKLRQNGLVSTARRSLRILDLARLRKLRDS